VAIPARTAMILFAVIGIFSLVVLTIHFSAMTSNTVYGAVGTDNVSNVPGMFSSGNIDCALRAGSCDIMHNGP
jgi:hypothetical protein